MKNIGQMLKQAQEMQSKVEEMQKRLADTEITGQSGGGMISVTLNGKGEARSVKIDPALFSADDREVIEDLIVAAINDARAKLDTHTAEEMSKLTGGIQLPPGMKLPFS